MFHQRKRPAKLAWTAQFRKAHKKVGIGAGGQRQRRCALLLAAAHVGPLASKLLAWDVSGRGDYAAGVALITRWPATLPAHCIRCFQPSFQPCLQDQDSQVSRKKRRGTTRVQNRGIANASLEVRGSVTGSSASQCTQGAHSLPDA